MKATVCDIKDKVVLNEKPGIYRHIGINSEKYELIVAFTDCKEGFILVGKESRIGKFERALISYKNATEWEWFEGSVTLTN